MNTKNLMNWVLTGNKEGTLTHPCNGCGEQVEPKEAIREGKSYLCKDCHYDLVMDQKMKWEDKDCEPVEE